MLDYEEYLSTAEHISFHGLISVLTSLLVINMMHELWKQLSWENADIKG